MLAVSLRACQYVDIRIWLKTPLCLSTASETLRLEPGCSQPHSNGINITGDGGEKIFSVFLSNFTHCSILTIEKLQDVVCKKHGHSAGQSQNRMPNAPQGGLWRDEGEAQREKHKAQILCEMNLNQKNFSFLES